VPKNPGEEWEMKFALKVVLIFAILMLAFAGGANAANIGGDNYDDGDLAVLRAILSLDLDNPTIGDYVVTDPDSEPFPVNYGDVLKLWGPDQNALDDDDPTVTWVQANGTWRVMYLAVDGANLYSLASLPYLSSLALSGSARIELPALNLYALEIYGNGGDIGNTVDVNVSQLTDLVAFKLTRTRITNLTLPPSLKLDYFTCTVNPVLTGLIGYYNYGKELAPFPGNNNVFFDNPLLLQRTITIMPTENGTITKNGGDTIYNGDSVTFTVAPNSGYKLDTFQINGTPVTLTGNTYTYNIINNVTVAATFVKENDDPTPAANIQANVQHHSWASLRGGKPDYKTATFQGIEFTLEFNQPTDISGGGNYFYLEAASYSLLDYSNNSRYGVINKETVIDGDAWISWDGTSWPKDIPGTSYSIRGRKSETKKATYFGKAEDRKDGIPNKGFEWELGGYSGSGRVMDFLTTEDQLQQCVPYVELSDNAVAYKSYSPSVGAAASMPFAGTARVRLFALDGTTELYRTTWNDTSFNEGGMINGTISLPVKNSNGNNVTKSDIGRIVVQTKSQSKDDGSNYYYRWNFDVVPDGVDESPLPDTSFFPRANNKPPSGRKVDILVASLPDMLHKVWLKKDSSSVSSLQYAITASVPETFGPFWVKSQEEADSVILEIDVDNFQNPDGTKSSEEIPTGSYQIVFQSLGGEYTGITDPILLAGTSGAPSNPSDSGGGGCNAGFGLFGLLLAGFVTHKYRKA
jgi:hypothetical protein